MVWAIATGIFLALLASILVLLLVVVAPRAASSSAHFNDEISFLLHDGSVVDASAQARDLLGQTKLKDASWAVLRQTFFPVFPAVPEEIAEGRKVYQSEGMPGLELVIDKNRHIERVELHGISRNPGHILKLVAVQRDHQMLSHVASVSPNPSWAMDKNNKTVWHNAAYQTLCNSVGATPAGTCPFELPYPLPQTVQTSRLGLIDPDGARLWFEVSSHPTAEGWLHFAIRIDSLVQAELAQRNFVQTLTKTFAHLPIGLAVFDRDHQLVLFNPALVDLTHLPVVFLSSRPTLLSFFDNMRDNRIMPEPKNYPNWRAGLSDMISAAREDRYSETWNLPSGLTYKITGRPHPDGAIAFLLEDISAEVTLTRRFRSELEMTQSVIDCFAESVAVFSHLGVLTLSNAAYHRQWNIPQEGRDSEISIIEATETWEAAFEPCEIWDDLQEFVLARHDRQLRECLLTTKSGQDIMLTIEPVSAGATLIRFSRLEDTDTFSPMQKIANG